jgi:hypothetical protein
MTIEELIIKIKKKIKNYRDIEKSEFLDDIEYQRIIYAEQELKFILFDLESVQQIQNEFNNLVLNEIKELKKALQDCINYANVYDSFDDKILMKFEKLVKDKKINDNRKDD